jgi:hypothetical protein
LQQTTFEERMFNQQHAHTPLLAALRDQLMVKRTRLLRVYQALVDHERVHYERVHGRV